MNKVMNAQILFDAVEYANNIVHVHPKYKPSWMSGECLALEGISDGAITATLIALAVLCDEDNDVHWSAQDIMELAQDWYKVLNYDNDDVLVYWPDVQLDDPDFWEQT